MVVSDLTSDEEVPLIRHCRLRGCFAKEGFALGIAHLGCGGVAR